MSTLKKTVTETIRKEVEVNLPYFSKSKNEKVFYKVLSSDRMLKVSLYDFHTTIEYTGVLELAFDSDCDECQSLDFSEAYVKAMSIIDEIYQKDDMYQKDDI